MTGGDPRLLRKIAFDDMPRDDCRCRESEQGSACLWSARECRNGSDRREIVTDDCAAAVEWVLMLSPLLSCELLVCRNHA